MESNVNQNNIDIDIEMEGDSIMQFAKLNDFCQLAIMEKMAIKDLISMSFTSKKFNIFAHDIAYRKWTKTSLSIVSTPVDGGHELKFDDGYFEKYLKYMSRSIRNVRVTTSDIPVERVLEFILRNCCQNLLSLELNVKERFNDNHGEQIKSLLNGLQSLNFSDAHPDTDVFGHILKHCTNLKKFTYYNTSESGDGGTMQWTLNEKLKLEEINIYLFNFHLANAFEKISRQFIRQNFQLRSLRYGAKRRTVDVKLNNGNVECVSLRYSLMHINLIREDLNKFTLNGNPGGLRLASTRCSYGNMQEIIRLDRQYPVLEWVTNLRDFSNFTNIQYLKHLTILELTFSERRNEDHPLIPFLGTLSTGLPNVERILLSFHPKALKTKHRFGDITKPFIANMAKLRVFVVRYRDDTFFEYDRNDVHDLNAARSALKNACPMLLSLGFYFKRIKPEFDVPDNSLIQMEVQRGFE